MTYKYRIHHVLLGCVVLLSLAIVALLVLSLTGGVFFYSLLTSATEPGPAERICNNLVAEEFAERNQCIISQSQTIYIPGYFPIGEVNLDYVSIGMRGFKLLKFTKSNTCEGNKEFVRATYLIGSRDNVTFLFCNKILQAIVYDD